MNMSYCRFTNTKTDLGDCLDSIRRGDHLSDSEADAGKKMFHEFLSLCWDYDIVDSYDGVIIESLFNGLFNGLREGA